MEFYIHKDYLNTPFHLRILDNGEVLKTTELNGSSLVIGTYEGWVVSKLYGFKVPRFPSQKYRRFFQGKNLGKTPPWHLILPGDAYRDEVQQLVSSLKNSFRELQISYYYDVFKKQGALFEELRPAKINSRYLMDHLGEDAMLKTFTPTAGYAKKAEYHRIATKTGRLKIKSGPMILHLKKENRHVLESRFPNGKIFQFDYTSVEPRVLLALTDKTKTKNRDIYKDICEEFDIPRQQAKTAILSRIYGSSIANVSKTLRSYVDYPEDFMEYVDEYFGIITLKNQIRQQYRKNDGQYIENYYGRRIDCQEVEQEHVLLNYYIQSTAVDVCLFGFNQIVSRLKNAEMLDTIVPLFVLHDALFMDVNMKYEHIIDKICKAGSTNIQGFEDIDFFLKSEELV